MIIEMAIIPLYPDLAPTWQYDDDGNLIGGPVCHRLDGGPGRTGTASLPMRMRCAERGLFLFPSGPQNCTSACQECDDRFGDYKAKGDDVTDDIVSERIKARSDQEETLRKESRTRAINPSKLPKVELTNADLPRIVKGREGDPIEKRPISFAFSREKVHGTNAKIGIVPLTRACLKHPKVRKEGPGGLGYFRLKS